MNADYLMLTAKIRRVRKENIQTNTLCELCETFAFFVVKYV